MKHTEDEIWQLQSDIAFQGHCTLQREMSWTHGWPYSKSCTMYDIRHTWLHIIVPFVFKIRHLLSMKRCNKVISPTTKQKAPGGNCTYWSLELPWLPYIYSLKSINGWHASTIPGAYCSPVNHSCWQASFFFYLFGLLRAAKHVLYKYLIYHVYTLFIYTTIYSCIYKYLGIYVYTLSIAIYVYTLFIYTYLAGHLQWHRATG